ncbi:hypothetical protein EYF80_042397 [Liparis tanakae]|uniref:Uncharacterized protein n=1 Tax=Liparis tanakae TaxID=230148 RepID=A0A4Z2G3K5_9TELE|nr:hypothetical protein EYF80_042397 [Liparis tanakae]
MAISPQAQLDDIYVSKRPNSLHRRLLIWAGLISRYSSDLSKATERFLRRYWRSLSRLFLTAVLPSLASISSAFSRVLKSGVVCAMAKRQQRP